MSAKLDMPLDDLVKSSKRGGFGGRGGRGGARGGRGGASRGGRVQQRSAPRVERSEPYTKPKSRSNFVKRSGDDSWQHDRFEDAGAHRGVSKVARAITRRVVGSPQVLSTGTKVFISNLEFNVSEDDLKELFGEIGDLKKVALNFDRAGRSKGTAEVIFVRRGDAEKAVKKYNDVVLDGRPMQITISGGAQDDEFEDVEEAPRRRIVMKKVSSAPTRGGRLASRPTLARGGKVQARAARPEKKKPATAEDLDAELDSYHASNAPAEE